MIQSNFGDRPLVAPLFTFLFNHQLLLPVSLIVHWLTWLGMGLVTVRFWRLMFPAQSRFALLPGLLSVAPILCKIQLVTFTVVFLVLLGPVLTFLAIFMLLSEQDAPWRKIVIYGLGLLLIAFSILISQYAVSTAAIAFVVCTARVVRTRKRRSREPIVVAALVAVCALVSGLFFSWLTRSTASSPYRPSFILESFSWKIQVVPFQLLSAIWQGALGGVLQALGAVALDSKRGLLSFACGVLFSGLVAIVIYKTSEDGPTIRGDRFSVITLLAAMMAGTLPVLLMGRTPGPQWDSRFWAPMLPVLSSLTVFILLYVVRRRLWLLVPVLCGFLAGYWTTWEIASAVSKPETTTTGKHGNQSQIISVKTDFDSNSEFDELARQSNHRF